MSYISSDRIEIFPYSRVRTIDGNIVNNDRLLYETRVANIIRQCLGMKSGNTGIILSNDIDASISGNTLTFNADFEFNIWGYYIKIAKDASIAYNDSDKYIVCTIQLAGSGVTEHINGSDDENVFKAIDISTNVNTSDTVSYITDENDENVKYTSISFTLASINSDSEVEVYIPNTYRVPESELKIISIDGNK